MLASMMPAWKWRNLRSIYVHVNRRQLSAPASPLRIGYVPEHFSLPLLFAKDRFDLSATLVPFPSGTGHMIEALTADEIDVSIGLTEAWLAGIAKAKSHALSAQYKIVGSYVKSSLCWAISAGKNSSIENTDQLRSATLGVSRIGSGSYIMPFVLANQGNWLGNSKPPSNFVPLQTFEALRAAVNDQTVDAFMWEHFTSKRHHDSGDIKRIGEIYTPWGSWYIAAQKPDDTRLSQFLNTLNSGIRHFRQHPEDAITYAQTHLGYRGEDVKEWIKTVDFVEDTLELNNSDIQKTIDILGKAGILDATSITHLDMTSSIHRLVPSQKGK